MRSLSLPSLPTTRHTRVVSAVRRELTAKISLNTSAILPSMPTRSDGMREPKSPSRKRNSASSRLRAKTSLVAVGGVAAHGGGTSPVERGADWSIVMQDGPPDACVRIEVDEHARRMKYGTSSAVDSNRRERPRHRRCAAKKPEIFETTTVFRGEWGSSAGASADVAVPSTKRERGRELVHPAHELRRRPLQGCEASLHIVQPGPLDEPRSSLAHDTGVDRVQNACRGRFMRAPSSPSATRARLAPLRRLVTRSRPRRA